MHPRDYAILEPHRPAVIMANSGETMTYLELDQLSNRIAHFLRERKVQQGDTIALMLENSPEFLAICWAAQRSGLYWTCLSSHLRAPEVEYILSDSGSKILFSSPAMADVLAEVQMPEGKPTIIMARGKLAGLHSLHDEVKMLPGTPVPNEAQGTDMLYSSGTTGRPKGIRRSLPLGAIDVPPNLVRLMSGFFEIPNGCRYLCPAPLYHAGPLRWCMGIHMLGGTLVVMEKFDAGAALGLIEKYRIEAAQFVPTHFVRMLKLGVAERLRHDLSSLKSVIHAAAPCPVDIKRAMIDWLGPIIFEYYSSTEGNGLCAISAEEWLSHPGSVGRAFVGKLYICGDDGEPIGPDEVGQIYFEGGWPVAYHDDPEKTAASHNQYGWSTIGDIGWADEDGYLYLTDRKSYVIISGGVNIYPQEIEDKLISHPKVRDAAVFGITDPDLGEKVVAVIQPSDLQYAYSLLEEELKIYLRESISGIKMPRQYKFVEQLPRLDTGKLNKREIRADWGNLA